ncbi:MAG: hypothetical protein UH850_08215 [Paludibacteraceae bacterium]|nr:hypothetical protein [Paludibacteraceae bacterium]MEE1063915.1 hypothetical protein [Paludibacteraceae bacterium]MEE1083698.1 hypothetical protein [Paludibacteraceae bacterium]
MKELLKFGGTLSPQKALITGIVGGFILLVFWYVVTRAGLISPKILPNPVDVIMSIPTLISEKNLFGNIGYTVSLNIVGYVIALVIAIPAGFIIGIYPLPRAMFQKPLEAIRFLPLPAVSGIMVASLGLGFTMKAAFLALGILIYILPVVTQKVMDLQNPNNPKDNVYLQTAKSIGMGKWQMFKHVYFPFVMSSIYSDIRGLVAISYTYVTIAENINKEGGLGACINTMTRQSSVDCVYALLLIIILIGIIQDYLFKILEPVIFKFRK